MACANNKDIEVVLLKWIREARNQNIILIYAVLQEKQRSCLQKLLILMILYAKIDGYQGLRNVMVLSPKRVCGEKSTVNQVV